MKQQLAASLVLAVALTGCSVQQSRSEDGSKPERVDVKTPFGNLKVRTDNVNANDTGLAVYPGATRVPEEKDHDTNSANVNLDTPFFSLKVVALKYHSDDPMTKVADFYRGEIKNFPGKVLECHPAHGGGVHINAHEGNHKGEKELSCDNDDPKSDEIEFEAGTPERMHIVNVKPAGKGTEFGLVFVRTKDDSGKI